MIFTNKMEGKIKLEIHWSETASITCLFQLFIYKEYNRFVSRYHDEFSANGVFLEQSLSDTPSKDRNDLKGHYMP